MGAKTLARLAAGLVGVGLLGLPAAMAQRIGDTTVQSVTMSSPQKQEITAYIKPHLEGLSGEAERQSISRRALLEPLTVQGVSVAFRIEYADQLLDGLKRLASAGGVEAEPAAINAVRVMGELATGKTLAALKEPLSDERVGIRREAAFAYERTLRVAGTSVGSPAVADGQVTTALGELAERLKVEDEPLVIDGLVLALDAGVNMGDVEQLTGVRERAVVLLGKTLAERLKQTPLADGVLDDAAARALGALGRAARDPRKLSADAYKSMGLLAGHVLARTRTQLQDGLISDRARADLVVCLAEPAYNFAHRQMGGSPKELGLCGVIAAGDKDRQFVNTVLELIGANGVLTAAPFGYADNEFVKE